MEKEGADSRLLPATLSYILSAGRRTLLLYLFPPVTVNRFVYVDKPETAVQAGSAAEVLLPSYYPSIIISVMITLTVCFP